jgi:hypothetical protein
MKQNAKDEETMQSVMVYCGFKIEDPVSMKSQIQDALTLSVDESKFKAVTNLFKK